MVRCSPYPPWRRCWSACAAADTAQAVLVTLWNAAMAGGGIIGGLLLDTLGPAALPWTGLVLALPTLAVVLTARVHTFPALATRE